MKKAILLISAFLLTNPVWASGHGPLFGLATPTNVKGGWSFDSGLMGRQGSESDLMLRAMAAYGITQDLQISFSAPWGFESAPLSPARYSGMMAGTMDFETILAWRFQRKATRIGKRFESTLFGGFIQPGFQNMEGMLGDIKKTPGIFTGISSGMASRSHYFWAGASLTRFAERQGDRRPTVFFYSLVWGYRPPSWRKDYPSWDWRLFAELTGEKSSAIKMDGLKMPETAGHIIFVGPSALGIYKHFAIQAGVQLPVYRDVGSAQQREKLRYAFNFSSFF